MSDAVPEPIRGDERSKRKTTEFCIVAFDGQRCMLVKDHDGPHEAVGTRGPLQWTLVDG